VRLVVAERERRKRIRRRSSDEHVGSHPIAFLIIRGYIYQVLTIEAILSSGFEFQSVCLAT